jgi:hypothetical protein
MDLKVAREATFLTDLHPGIEAHTTYKSGKFSRTLTTAGIIAKAIHVAGHGFVFPLQLMEHAGIFHGQGRLLSQGGDEADFLFG